MKTEPNSPTGTRSPTEETVPERRGRTDSADRIPATSDPKVDQRSLCLFFSAFRFPLSASRPPVSTFRFPLSAFHAVACAAALSVPLAAQDEAPRLEGMIARADGSPATNALVFVFSAAPREGGRPVISPHHYPDCGKFARTDAQGQFRIQPVDKDLLFRLLVTAPGHRPDYIKDADPMFGGSQLRLKRLQITGVPAGNRVIGKLLAPDGRAVAGARVEVGATRIGESTTYSSSSSGRVDPMAVSDDRGEFFLDCTNGITAIMTTIDAPRLAKRRIWLEPGQANLIRLKPGVTAKGRLLRDGKPVPEVSLSMTTEERWSEVFMRGFDVASDSQGRFTLLHLPADMKFVIATKMKEMAPLGVALAPTQVATGHDGTTVDLGDLELGRTHTLRGRVVLADGQPVPARTRIYLGLERGSDSQDTRLDPDGWFEFAGVPADEIDLSVRIPGYRISARNPNKDWLNEGRLVGKLDKDLDEFFIHLEPGQRLDRGDAPSGAEAQPHQKPLRGAKL
jgi:hypothetical protein